MEEARSPRRARRRAWRPWALLGGMVVLSGGGGVLAASSISALEARNAQLEQEANESEARVAELQALRVSMERRLRVLEQQQQGATSLPGDLRKARELGTQMVRRETARLNLTAKLKEELTRGDAWLDAIGTEALRLELSERLLFEPGQSNLTPRGTEVLARAGAVLAAVEGHTVEVAAHTDELPVPAEAETEGTSWELSTARAATVVRALHEGPARLAQERLSATGHASFRPVVPSDSPVNRLRNRRVTLMLRPLPEAVPAPATPPSPPAAAPALQASKKTAQR
ncbi:OmpA family protein [Stigmatella aurantiaca]|uniref:Chemotaxis MotB protein n=2 Tax=Stigmatella aurantiaca (strain DW4/3-1) TaxID=378806 RepID=E3FY62_STIAD|nr:OmpA family protein [Stigmatella aurantiaca]ADO68599.1 chemotaxis MotB protein [Stigmatella aurantiaca DW4/3-1]